MASLSWTATSRGGIDYDALIETRDLLQCELSAETEGVTLAAGLSYTLDPAGRNRAQASPADPAA
jgi:hypothetical protein